MISLKRYNGEEDQPISNLNEIELAVECNYEQQVVVLKNVLRDGFDLDIKNEGFNPHLKEVNMSFEILRASSDLLTIYNNKNHKIISVKIGFDDWKALVFEELINENKIIKLVNTIMYIDNLEITETGMRVYLRGHMVV